VLAASNAGWTVSVTADRCDGMGCLVWELAFARKGAPAADARLTSWAEGVAKRVKSLAEPLKVIEVDTVRNEALLRSQEPSQRGEHVLYYEVLLRGTQSATLRRYQAQHTAGSHRQQVGFVLTHEALAKLAEDVAAGQ
jgi:hypothetical protein